MAGKGSQEEGVTTDGREAALLLSGQALGVAQPEG